MLRAGSRCVSVPHTQCAGRRGDADEGAEPSRYYQLYDLLDNAARPKTLFMLTATPINNRLSDFRVVADARLDDLPANHFDLVLANPPYYAQQGVARLFIDTARRVLRPGGRLYVVTKQADVVGAMIHEAVGEPAVVTRRDYAVLMARRPG